MAIFDEGSLFLNKQWSHLLFIDFLNVISKHFFKLGSEITLQLRWHLIEAKMTYCNIVSSPLYFDNAETINHSFPSSMVLEHLYESVVVYLERCESQ
jgi:hypothetical protein